MPEKSNRNFAIIGLGTFGSTIATELVRFDNYVLGIDNQERVVGRIAETLSEAIIADGSDEEALREAGVDQYDVAVVAIGEDLEASILCTMHLKVLGVPCIWVKAISRTHHRILTRLGADRVLQPEQEMGRHVAQVLHNPLGPRLCEPRKRLFRRGLPGSGEARRQDRRRIRPARQVRDLSPSASCAAPSSYPLDDALQLEQDDKLLLLGRRQALRDFGDSL